MKYVLSLLTSLTLLTLLVMPVRASGFYLQSIGSLDVSGGAFSHFWYTAANPILTGVAPVGATVNVTVDGTADTAIAGSDGTWVYQTAIAEGDHAISLSTETAGSYAFTLTIGEVPEGVGIGGIESPETPVAGVSTPTIIGILLGFGLLAIPLYLRKYI